MSAFAGLSAFPLTPFDGDAVDDVALARLVQRLAASEVGSVTVLGSTGVYPYLDAVERARVAHIAVENAAGKPVMVGIGALRTSHVLANADSAQAAGADGLLLAPLGYHKLTDAEVFELFHAVTSHSPLPVIVYDNPRTTGFEFSLELYGRVAALPGIASIKIPGVPLDLADARKRIADIRAAIPPDVTIGISRDSTAATGLIAGCDGWYSSIAGTLPEVALRIAHAASSGDGAHAIAESERLAPLWELLAAPDHGIRVVAAIAEHLGLVPHDSLPRPLRGLDAAHRRRVVDVVDELNLVEV